VQNSESGGRSEWPTSGLGSVRHNADQDIAPSRVSRGVLRWYKMSLWAPEDRRRNPQTPRGQWSGAVKLLGYAGQAPNSRKARPLQSSLWTASSSRRAMTSGPGAELIGLIRAGLAGERVGWYSHERPIM